MNVLLDTNVVARYFNRADPLHQSVIMFLGSRIQDGGNLCVAPQVLFEYWVVATRPEAVNGLGLEPHIARELIETARESFTLFPDPADLVDHWLNIVTQHQIRGRRAHDCRLVAWMTAHDISDVITLNASHFATIRAHTPAS